MLKSVKTVKTAIEKMQNAFISYESFVSKKAREEFNKILAFGFYLNNAFKLSEAKSFTKFFEKFKPELPKKTKQQLNKFVTIAVHELLLTTLLNDIEFNAVSVNSLAYLGGQLDSNKKLVYNYAKDGMSTSDLEGLVRSAKKNGGETSDTDKTTNKLSKGLPSPNKAENSEAICKGIATALETKVNDQTFSEEVIQEWISHLEDTVQVAKYILADMQKAAKKKVAKEKVA